MGLRERLEDPRSPDRRPRRVAYALPTLFTAGNIFLGYISIMRSFHGAMLASSGGFGASENFAVAAQAIGAAVFLDRFRQSFCAGELVRSLELFVEQMNRPVRAHRQTGSQDAGRFLPAH